IARSIVGRIGLPPHSYIESRAQPAVPSPVTTPDTALVRYLSRGKVTNVLKALDANSLELWRQGHAYETLKSELSKGNVSISIYHLDGNQVGQAERNKVASMLNRHGV